MSSVLDEEYIHVTIKDTGCRISAGEIQSAFDTFYQGDTPHSVQGDGLGLAPVKRMLHIADGEISTESDPGSGSTLPLKLKRGYLIIKRP